MSERLSTGLRDYLLGESSMRKALEDCVMKIYSGAAPASANDAVTGVLLAIITKSSGTVSSGERSTPGRWQITIPDSHAEGATVKAAINIGAAGAVTYTYTNTPDAGTAEQVMAKVAQMLNDIYGISAIYLGSTIQARTVVIQGRIAGEDIDVVDGAGTITITPTEIEVAARLDAIYFANPSSGAMSKASETWSGLIATSGVAGYFRFVTSSDDGTLSTTQVRAQGSVSTSGAELNLSNTSLVAATTLTIDTYSISLPAE